MMRVLALLFATLLGVSPALAQFTVSSPITFSANFNKNTANGQVGIQYWDNIIQDPFPVRTSKVGTPPAANNGDLSGTRTHCISNGGGCVPGALDPGWTNTVCDRVIIDWMHGVNTPGQKTSSYGIYIDGTTFGAGQNFGITVSLNSLSANDHQNIVASQTYYGGVPVTGDEGPVGYSLGMWQPHWHDTAHVQGAITRGTGLAHTTAAIASNRNVQAVPVDNITGFNIGQWVIINHESPLNGYRQAMKITSIGPGNTISGLYEIDQSAGVSIRPATVLPLRIDTEWADYGEHRFLVNLDQASYSTGTISNWDVDSYNINGTGTNFTSGMVGGDVNNVGCISLDGQTNSYGQASWFPIDTVASPTQVTTQINRTYDAALGAYHIKPCAFILRVLGFDPETVSPDPRFGYLVLDTNNFPWPSGSLIETATGPVIGGALATLNGNNFLPNSSAGMYISEQGTYVPSRGFLNINNYATNVTTTRGSYPFFVSLTDTSGGGVKGHLNGLAAHGIRDFLFADFAAGGSMSLDHLGMVISGTKEDVFTDMQGVRGSPVGAYGTFELDPIWNWTDHPHNLFTAAITDNSGRLDNKLISLNVTQDAGVTWSERFAVLEDGTITKGHFAGTTPGVYLPFGTSIPFILPPSGTFAANGAFTLSVALPRTYATAYMYVPANTIGAGVPAGWYYTEMNTPTQGQVFNNTYAGSDIPIRYYGLPSKVPFSGTAGGTLTPVTTPVPAHAYIVPADTLDNREGYRVFATIDCSPDTNNKSWSVNYGPNSVGQGILNQSTQYGMRPIVFVSSAGDTQFNQLGDYGTGDTGSTNVIQGSWAAQVPTTATSPQPLAVYMATGSASSWMILERTYIELLNAGGTRTN